MEAPTIRRGTYKDLPSLVRIYNHYVENTHITFDLEPLEVSEREGWLTQFAADGRYQIFVACRGDEVVGYACSTRFRAKAAYDISVETAIYLDPDAIGMGLGMRLYSALFEALSQTDVHGAYAGIALPNPASIALHERIGFRHLGTFEEVGRKFDKLWNVAWYEKRIAGKENNRK
jgi:phosphinothricin acetyltransferase